MYSIQIKDCRVNLGASAQSKVQFHLPEFTVNEGQQIALTGPSGCGKTTLLNLISGLIKPEQGNIEIMGQEITALSSSALDAFRGKTMGFIYQTFNLLDGFSALENVMVGMRFGRSIAKREWKSRAQELLQHVGLQQRMQTRVNSLSVGERQRVAIARAVANRPAILLADEPTGSLDPKTAQEVFQLILQIAQEENCTLVFVTHDHELSQQFPTQFDCQHLIQNQNEVAA